MNKSLNSSFDLPSPPGQGILSNNWNSPKLHEMLTEQGGELERGGEGKSRKEEGRGEETGGYVG